MAVLMSNATDPLLLPEALRKVGSLHRCPHDVRWITWSWNLVILADRRDSRSYGDECSLCCKHLPHHHHHHHHGDNPLILETIFQNVALCLSQFSADFDRGPFILTSRPLLFEKLKKNLFSWFGGKMLVA